MCYLWLFALVYWFTILVHYIHIDSVIEWFSLRKIVFFVAYFHSGSLIQNFYFCSFAGRSQSVWTWHLTCFQDTCCKVIWWCEVGYTMMTFQHNSFCLDHRLVTFKKYWKMEVIPSVKLFIGRGVPKSGPVPEYILWSCLKNVPHMD